jgi:hypothetical protein
LVALGVAESVVIAAPIAAGIFYAGGGALVGSVLDTLGPAAAGAEGADGADFATAALRASHFADHGADLGYSDEASYLQGARNLFANPDVATFVRPSGDVAYYLQDTNEFGVLSNANVIRTYFAPVRGAAYFLNDVLRYISHG